MEIKRRDLIRFPPNPKKGSCATKILGNRKCETLTLLSDWRVVDKGTHQTQIVSYVTPSCLRSCRDVPLDPNNLVEELDTALKVRQSAPDIVVSHRKRPTMRYATRAREAYQFWHCRCPRLQTTMIFLPPSPPLCELICEPKEVRSSSL